MAVCLAALIAAAPAAAQPRDTMNSTPRTFAGQTTRDSDFGSSRSFAPLLDRVRPFRDTPRTYPAAAPREAPRAGAGPTLSRPTGLQSPSLRRQGFTGSSTPVDEPDAPPGTPVPFTDRISSRGFVSPLDVIGLPVLSADGRSLGRVETVATDVSAARQSIIVRPVDEADAPLRLSPYRLVYDAARGALVLD